MCIKIFHLRLDGTGNPSSVFSKQNHDPAFPILAFPYSLLPVKRTAAYPVSQARDLRFILNSSFSLVPTFNYWLRFHHVPLIFPLKFLLLSFMPIFSSSLAICMASRLDLDPFKNLLPCISASKLVRATNQSSSCCPSYPLYKESKLLYPKLLHLKTFHWLPFPLRIKGT